MPSFGLLRFIFAMQAVIAPFGRYCAHASRSAARLRSRSAWPAARRSLSGMFTPSVCLHHLREQRLAEREVVRWRLALGLEPRLEAVHRLRGGLVRLGELLLQTRRP